MDAAALLPVNPCYINDLVIFRGQAAGARWAVRGTWGAIAVTGLKKSKGKRKATNQAQSKGKR
jgi:hypothetical protein